MANKLELKLVLSALDKITAPLKKIRSGSDSTSKSLKEMNQKLKDITQQQKRWESSASYIVDCKTPSKN